MIAVNFLYILLAILGLGFLIFIHELGHYWVARRQGMRVIAFAIGFGKPLFSWMRDGVKWQICMLPFGGYVKIAGMQKEGELEPSEIPDGFYGKSPWKRIKVALAGPLVNIVFAFVVFTFLWVSGGRNKPFSEFTHHIGWVDEQSPLYERGVRPGDLIQTYSGRPFNGFKDLLITGLMRDETTQIAGKKIDYLTGETTPFNYTLKNYENASFLGKDKINTIGILAPARYLIFAGPEFMNGSPMQRSGIQANDRLVWVDGEMVFSHQQLTHLINASSAFLTIERDGKVIQTKVPRIQLSDLQLTPPEKGEFDDWQHEASLKGKLQDLYFIPYNLSPTLTVESSLNFIDEEDQAKFFNSTKRNSLFGPLQEGDRILAVDGAMVKTPYELLLRLQGRHILLIAERDPAFLKKELWTKVDEQFEQFNGADLKKIISSIGTPSQLNNAGNFHLLNPIAPLPLTEFPLTTEQRATLAQELAQSKKEIEAIQDPVQRSDALEQLEKSHRKLVLGIPLKDREIRYNPAPAQQFFEVVNDTYRTLASLVTGVVNPKYVAGPVGIVQIVHQSWTVGVKEALFWMAIISLNLGLINLLPLPVLDGGHILFSVVEMVIRRPIKSRTMERLIIPFIVMLIGFFLFVTYNDIARLFSKFL